jgi:hypothetical protein
VPQGFSIRTGTFWATLVIVDGGKEIFFLSLSDTDTIYGVVKNIRIGD